MIVVSVAVAVVPVVVFVLLSISLYIHSMPLQKLSKIDRVLLQFKKKKNHVEE
jgi:hypothetical protein